MYDWRRMADRERREALAARRAADLPWHRPPHQDWGEGAYLLTAACYEHAPIIGATPQRMAEWERTLLETVAAFCGQVHAWCVLPNHYHTLVETTQVKTLVAGAGQLHGRTSHAWNREDCSRGRKVWHGCEERAMRSEAHFWATMNYVHHNPVRHGYVTRWEDWPFSSASQYLAGMGREEAERIWRSYPLLDYGRGWDAPEM